MKYKKLSMQEKKKAVAMVVRDKESIAEAARATGASETAIGSWLCNPEINDDAEYVRIRNQERVLRKHDLKAPEDPFPEGVNMASNVDPKQQAREIRDLRKKNEFLEDKVAYLEKLYEILGMPTGQIVKKNVSRQSTVSSKEEGGMSDGSV